MYVIDGIAYAGEPKPPRRISGVRPLKDFKLWIRFNDGIAKIFDFKNLLSSPAFAPLNDKSVFNSVYIDYGVPVWNNGEIDISPEYLYQNSEPADGINDDAHLT
ncbi:MAG: DUF2442 domain-containing protein [Oscillospiraceae bacterium]|nr:DUF2442 domain-containing protein [Oscillospiraceae bacterium]MDY3064196.1 DUF2442 domain-containing protein [Oscillospiraceae bacterium]